MLRLHLNKKTKIKLVNKKTGDIITIHNCHDHHNMCDLANGYHLGIYAPKHITISRTEKTEKKHE